MYWKTEFEEFQSVCPGSGQPDQAKLTIQMSTGDRVVEMKSLKYYLQSFRDVGIFHEHFTNKILDDLVKACKPRWARVEAIMNPRGGISTTVTAEYEKKK